MAKIILDLCGGTGSWSKFYKDNNYDVRVITYPDYDVSDWVAEGGYITFRGAKPMTIKISDIRGILAAPPCTMFSIARNDKTAKLPRDLRGGMKLVNGCLGIIHECLYNEHKKNADGLKFWALENPYSGYLRRFLGKPTLVFQPYEYGDPYTKKTAIWGEFNLPKRNEVKPLEFEHPTTPGAKDFVSCVEHFADLKDIPDGYCEHTGYSRREVLRSMTPLGFAKEFYEANK